MRLFKRAKCDLNGINIAIFAAKITQQLRALPPLTRLSCIGLCSTGPKLDNFCAKNIYFWFKSSLLPKLWLRFWSHLLLQTDFSSDYTSRIRNELINAAGIVSFFKDEYKIVALKYQVLCAKVQSIL